MTPITLAVGADAPVRLRVAATTLPRSFGRAVGAPDAHVVGGAAGWTERVRALVDAGSMAVLVGDPVAEDARALRVSADRAGALIMLAPAGAEDPAVAVLREAVGASDGGLLECRVIVPSSASSSATVVAILTLIRGVDSPVRELGTVSSDRNGFQVTGRLESDRGVLLATDASDAVQPVARLRLISTTGLVEADIPLTERRRPAVVRTTSAQGEWNAPSDYLGPSRAVLLRLHSAITQSLAANDLEDFQRDEPFARRLHWS
jgi:hypothetical protein